MVLVLVIERGLVEERRKLLDRRVLPLGAGGVNDRVRGGGGSTQLSGGPTLVTICVSAATSKDAPRLSLGRMCPVKPSIGIRDVAMAHDYAWAIKGITTQARSHEPRAGGLGIPFANRRRFVGDEVGWSSKGMA